jgi:uncharacterized protein DUF3175
MDDTPHRWSQEITTEDHHDVGGGVFADGSAEEIAEAVIEASRDDGPTDTVERRAMSKLTFYENRAGRNLSSERRAVLEEAKAILRERFRTT